MRDGHVYIHLHTFTCTYTRLTCNFFLKSYMNVHRTGSDVIITLLSNRNSSDVRVVHRKNLETHAGNFLLSTTTPQFVVFSVFTLNYRLLSAQHLKSLRCTKKPELTNFLVWSSTKVFLSASLPVQFSMGL